MPRYGKSGQQPTQTGDRVILNAADIDRSLTRIAHEILESNRGARGLTLLGIPRRGYPLAARIAAKLHSAEPAFDPQSALGQLDITMFRDDLSSAPPRPLQHTTIPRGSIDASTVILVDDVLYSGRTIRAALDALTTLGRPAAVRLAVLIDRGHRQLPIRADYVGKNVPTSAAERIHVLVHEIDPGPDQVTIAETAPERSPNDTPAQERPATLGSEPC